MMCRSRYLTADGRVLRCLLDHRKVLKGRYTHRNAHNTTTAGMQWINEDPCRWEAPDCWSCEGSGRIGVDDHERDCHVCDGTGVDESVPLTLVGIGSTVSVNGYEYLVIRTDPWVGLGFHNGDFDKGGHRDLAPAIERGDMKVVRAVPPAHEKEGSV